MDTAKAFVNDNLDRTVTNADWAACTDSEALDHPSDTIPGVTNGSNCISYGPNDDGIAFLADKSESAGPDDLTPFFRDFSDSLV